MLTEAVRRKPYSIVLLDEIEKAHPDVFNVLLQLLDDGRLTDNKGRTVDFKNTILIMTSNVGSDIIQETINNQDFKNSREELEKCRKEVIERLKLSVRPEFLNRIDEIIMFHPLTKENVKEILMIQIEELRKRLAPMSIKVNFTENFIEYLCDKGYDPAYGARPIKRVLQNEVVNELAKEILAGKVSAESEITVDMQDGFLKIK